MMKQTLFLVESVCEHACALVLLHCDLITFSTPKSISEVVNVLLTKILNTVTSLRVHKAAACLFGTTRWTCIIKYVLYCAACPHLVPPVLSFSDLTCLESVLHL